MMTLKKKTENRKKKVVMKFFVMIEKKLIMKIDFKNEKGLKTTPRPSLGPGTFVQIWHFSGIRPSLVFHY
jgi:hypothetical protein